ncbi:unnamed protein product, partial [Toxocara canis]|uniref:HAP2-GCS1 domain-containing protein n=1 Tax=Toxocara canis TaxID=6265 RepID=A0A183VFA2_TOXCA
DNAFRIEASNTYAIEVDVTSLVLRFPWINVTETKYMTTFDVSLGTLKTLQKAQHCSDASQQIENCGGELLTAYFRIDPDNDSLDAAAIAAIVEAVLLLVLIAFLLWFILLRPRCASCCSCCHLPSLNRTKKDNNQDTELKETKRTSAIARLEQRILAWQRDIPNDRVNPSKEEVKPRQEKTQKPHDRDKDG